MLSGQEYNEFTRMMRNMQNFISATEVPLPATMADDMGQESSRPQQFQLQRSNHGNGCIVFPSSTAVATQSTAVATPSTAVANPTPSIAVVAPSTALETPSTALDTPSTTLNADAPSATLNADAPSTILGAATLAALHKEKSRKKRRIIMPVLDGRESFAD
jgi:hypothetical protein